MRLKFSIVYGCHYSVLETSIRCQFYHNRIFLTHYAEVGMWVWVLFLILLAKKFKAEWHSEICNNSFHCHFSKCLSKANSLSTIKWCICIYMPFRSIRCLGNRIVFVESFWMELVWLLPVFRIIVKSVKVYSKLCSFLNVVLANGTILKCINWSIGWSWTLEPKSFLHNHV